MPLTKSKEVLNRKGLGTWRKFLATGEKNKEEVCPPPQKKIEEKRTGSKPGSLTPCNVEKLH